MARENPLLRSLEFAGRESFLFLVHHLAVVFVILLLGKYGLNLYVRTVLAVAFSFGTLPALVRAREALSRKRFFVPAGLVIWAGFFTAGVVHLAYGRVPIAMVTGIPAMYAFALVFPTLRARLLRRYVADPTG
ncbi:MAG: hypothetical protein M5R36_13605 [Deltaproteobacteria bacterium]|nr:hypothetical protein [Deltaproteobacteria bacterium]